MRIVREIITLEEVKREFDDVGESLDDLSIIRLSLVQDTHDDSLDLSVEIYGDGDPDETPPILELGIDNPNLLMTETEHFQGIDRQKIPTLFELPLIQELTQRGLKIEWNNRDETEEAIDLSNPGEGYLLAMIR